MIAKPTAVRMNDIAEAARTSIATVSMALAGDPRISPETRRRVQEVSRRLGYRRRRASPRAARRAGAEAWRRFAFLSLGRLDQPMHALLVQALSEQAAVHDVHLEIAALPLDAPPSALIDRARQLARAADGLILMGPIHVETLRQIDEAGIPAVMYGYPLGGADLESPPLPIVASDWMSMGHRATRALLDTGHKRIGFLSGELMPNMWHARCFDGYACALLHAGLPIDRATTYFAEPDDTQAGVSAAKVFAAMKHRPTAYVAINAGTAGRFVASMRDAGVAVPPRHLVVCGYRHLMHEFGLDGYPLVYMDPAKIVAAAITHLRARCLRRTEDNATVLVPFSSQDLPTP